MKFFNLPCGRFDTVPIIDIAKIVEEEISIFDPNIVITHSNTDVNNDHRLTFQAVLQSTRPSINNNVNMVLSFEILSSTERSFYNNFNPNYFVKLNKNDISKKQNALRCFKSEIENFLSLGQAKVSRFLLTLGDFSVVLSMQRLSKL